MNATARMNAIAEQGLCIGCGICQAIASAGNIRMQITATGDERPVVVGELDDATVDNNLRGLPRCAC